MPNIRWISAMVAVALALLIAAGASRLAADIVTFQADDSVEMDDAVNFVPDVPVATQPTEPAEKPAAPAPAAPQPRTDVVVTLQGDRLTGDVVAADAKGRLTLKGPQYDGQVQVQVSMLDHVALKGEERETGKAEVVLTNGDRLIGELAAITAENVQVETKAAGRLLISRKVVSAVNLAKPSGVLAESNFIMGDIAPWVTRSDAWSVADGAMAPAGGGYGAPLYVEVPPSKESYTVVAKVRSLGGPIHCNIVLFCDKPEWKENGPSTNCMAATLQATRYGLHSTSATGGNGWGSGGQAFQQGTLRFTYDFAAGRARFWVDSQMIMDYQMDAKPDGKYAIFNPLSPMRIERLAVLRGVVPPSAKEEGGSVEAGPAGAVVEYANADRVSVSAITLADGQVVAATTYGELRCPIANLGRIVFGKQGQEEPRKAAGDVRVTASAGRFTLQFDRLTADSLVGRSDYLGEVTVRRAAVRQIQFNPYR